MAYTTIDKPSDYFETKLWTGNGSSQDISLDFAPNWIWAKQRSSTRYHNLQDSIRGVGLQLFANENSSDNADTSNITAFNSDGYSLGDGDNVNKNSSTYVGWSWKAGTAFSNDASSTSVGSIDSAGRVNTDAGFSIIGWTGNGTNATIAHGLGAVPKMIWFKSRSAAENINVYHANTGNTHYTELNTGIAATDHGRFQDTTPTSTVFSVSGTNAVNHEDNPMIAYCWAEIPGYSKIGTYEGQNVLDNVYIHLGFRPEIVFFKNVDDATSWKIFDAGRDPFNDGTGTIISGNENNAEDDNTAYNMNFLSNGIKMRGQNNNINKVNTYIYAAWAKNPFVNSEGVPANAV